jgi:omega-amidase
MQDLKIAIIQSNLLWEDIPGNLALFDQKIDAIKEKSDLIVLPEMFSTAFSMDPASCCEKPGGQAFLWMKEKAAKKNCCITGSIISCDQGKYYNRMIWMAPDGSFQHYDKKHLFRFAGEHEVFSAGKEKITPSLKGWNLRPLVCYDLRFPVWSKNTFSHNKFEYDCLIYAANWPEKRREAWISLLVARAIENQAYVIGVNRIGTDGKGNAHSGDSMVIDPKGNILVRIPANIESTELVSLSYSEMQNYREHFLVSLDWDKFKIED